MKTGEPKIWSRVQPHGGTQIPKEIRERMELRTGDVLLWGPVEIGVVKVMKGSVEEVSQEWPHKTSK